MKDFQAVSISISPGCVQCAFGDGIAIFDTETNAYFSMNAVGQFIWTLLETRIKPEEIVEKVAARYGIDPSLCRDDVHGLIDDLAAHRLIVLS